MEGTTAPNRASFWAEQASALKPGQEADMGTTNNNLRPKAQNLQEASLKRRRVGLTLPSFRTAWGHLWPRCWPSPRLTGAPPAWRRHYLCLESKPERPRPRRRGSSQTNFIQKLPLHTTERRLVFSVRGGKQIVE